MDSFAHRTPIQIVPGESVAEGDLLIFDQARGVARKARPDEDGRKFVVPKGSRVTGDGYLVMPR